MAMHTVEQFSEVLKVPVERLLAQLRAAGIDRTDPQAKITDEEKMALLTYLRNANGRTEEEPDPESSAELRELNHWAAEFIGHGSPALIDTAVSTAWFTESMNMANLVLERARDEGLDIEVERDGNVGRVTANERSYEGALIDLPANVVRACMHAYRELLELEELAELQALDRWAAEFIGEDDIESAVETQWYTTSPGAAFVVLWKAATEGCLVNLTMDEEEAEVTCGDVVEQGPTASLGVLIVRACYRAVNED